MTRYLLIALSLLSLARAENAASFEKQVVLLGDKDFKVREQASQELMREVEKDPQFAKQLERFANHEDPEIRTRIRDLIRDLPEVLEWMEPDREGEMKSRKYSPGALKLTVKNRSDFEIQTYWIDWEGNRQLRRMVKPGEKITFAKTYPGHVWLIANATGEGKGIYIAGEKDAQIIFTGEEKK